MTLLDYTTYEDVRATLGVSDDELENETLALEVYSNHLGEELYDVSKTLDTLYRDIKAKAEGARTSQEERVYKLVRAFSTYAVARQVGTALPMLAPKSLSDGKATMSRFSSDPYKKVLENIREQYDIARGRLLTAVDDLSSLSRVTVARTLFSRSGSGYNPVTGEGG